MSGRYASGTVVDPSKSRAEIENTLRRYGATSFMYGEQPQRALLMFEAKGRRIRFVVNLPDRNENGIRTYKSGSYWTNRTDSAWEAAFQQAVRQRWRALALVIKAKLEAVESGISIFEDEFMANIVMPNGEDFGAWARPQIAQAYESGTMPDMLALPKGAKR
jgi:hypothetical protein